MKKNLKIILIAIVACSMLLLGACDNDEGNHIDFIIETVNTRMEACTGTCLTREDMAQQVYNYEKVQEQYIGYEVSDKIVVPDLKLVTPGEHEHDENTRYEITLLDRYDNGLFKGVEVKVMKDTSACKLDNNVEGTHWELVDITQETNDDVIKSDNSIRFMGSGTEYITQYENDFDSSSHALMTFRCHMDEELPQTLNPGDEIEIRIIADIISEGEIITNATMSCNMIIPNIFEPTSSYDEIYAGGNTIVGQTYSSYMEDTYHFTVSKKGEYDTIMIVFYTSAGQTNWIYDWK